jgi:hypothetical protein
MNSYPVSTVFGFIPDFIDYCSDTTFNCFDPVPPCHSPLGLEFDSLWTITTNYYNIFNATGALVSDSTADLASAALSATASYKLVGEGSTQFPKADIWSRLTTWKFMLIQLIATMSRPPLSILVGVFTVVHLTSDPIGSMEDLMYKLEGCQQRAVYWRHEIQLIDGAAGIIPSKTGKEERK